MQPLGHEKLHVYQYGIKYVAWVQSVLAGIESSAAVLDHVDRSSESIIESIANGNSRRVGPVYLDREKLDVYKVGLEVIRWVDDMLASSNLGTRYASRLDKCSTAIVLNRAEGNGRFSVLDHKRLLDISYTAAMRAASTRDTIVARGLVGADGVRGGKTLLARLVPLLLGLRGYLDQSTEARYAQRHE